MSPSIPGKEQEQSAHLARMCRELRDLASQSQFGMLAYLLDMARLEAEQIEMDRMSGSAKQTSVNRASVNQAHTRLGGAVRGRGRPKTSDR